MNYTTWPVPDVPACRLLGAAILGCGTSSILAYRELTEVVVSEDETSDDDEEDQSNGFDWDDDGEPAE